MTKIGEFANKYNNNNTQNNYFNISHCGHFKIQCKNSNSKTCENCIRNKRVLIDYFLPKNYNED